MGLRRRRRGGNRWRGSLAATAQVLTTPEMLLLAAVAFMHGMTQTMYRPLIAPYAASLGAGPFLAGAAVAMQSLPGLALAVPAGSVADRLGTGRVLVIGGLGVTAGGVLLAAVETLATLLGAMVLIGFGAMCVALAAQGLATIPVSGEDVDTRRVASFGAFVLVGHLIGPTLGGLLTDAGGYGAAFWAIGVLGMAFVAVTVALRRYSAVETDAAAGAPDPPAEEPTASAEDPGVGARGAYRRAGGLLRAPNIPAALVLSALGVALLNLRTSFLPLYLDQLGWSASAIGVLLSGAAAIALVSRVGFPMIERTVPPKLLFRFCVIGGAMSIALAVATRSVPVIVVATAASGILLGALNPSSLTLLARLAGADQRQLAIGMRITVSRLSQTLGPVAFGAVAAVGGLRPAFYAITIASSVAGGVMTRRLTRRR